MNQDTTPEETKDLKKDSQTDTTNVQSTEELNATHQESEEDQDLRQLFEAYLDSAIPGTDHTIRQSVSLEEIKAAFDLLFPFLQYLYRRFIQEQEMRDKATEKSIRSELEAQAGKGKHRGIQKKAASQVRPVRKGNTARKPVKASSGSRLAKGKRK